MRDAKLAAKGRRKNTGMSKQTTDETTREKATKKRGRILKR